MRSIFFVCLLGASCFHSKAEPDPYATQSVTFSATFSGSPTPCTVTTYGNRDLELVSACTISHIQLPAKAYLEFTDNNILRSFSVNKDEVFVSGIAVQGRVELNYNQSLRGGTLSHDQEIEGIPLTGYATFTEASKLQSGTLSRDAEVRGLWLKAGSSFTLRPEQGFQEGALTLARDQEISGVPCGANTQVYLYYDGKVRSATLPNTGATLQGLSLAGGSAVSFLDNGLLSTATLAQEQVVDGLPIAKGSPLQFYSNGKVESATLRATSIQGLKLKAESNVGFYENGYLSQATLDSKPQPYNSLSLAGESQVIFYESGTLQSATLAQPHSFKGISLKGQIAFYEDGAPQYGLLAHDQKIGKLPCKGGVEVSLYPSGKLQSATLAASIVLEDTRLEEGTVVEVSEDGYLLLRPTPSDKYRPSNPPDGEETTP